MQEDGGLLRLSDAQAHAAMMVATELIRTVRGQFVLDGARHVRSVVTVHVDGYLVLRVVLSSVPVLLVPQPSRLNESHPTIVSENSADECLHFLRDYLISFHVPLDLNEQRVVLVNL